jgi:UDP-N-acetyl-2-amino-2-deoxyglucuronate dehydrogenase
MRHASSAGSSFLVGAIHAVDSMRYILGADVTEVTARGTEQGNYYHYPPTVQALVRYTNGAIGTISSSLVGQTGYVLNLEVVGTEASVRNDKLFGKSTDGWQTLPEPGPGSGDVSQLPFPQLIEDFFQAIRSGSPPKASLASIRNTHDVCFAVDRSLETGQTVTL